MNYLINQNFYKHKNLLILDNKNLKQAFFKLNKNGEKILFVVNKNKKLLGSLSDGDIRKSLIKGFGLEDNIKKFINKKFIYVNNIYQIKKKLNKIKKEKIKFVPICSKSKKILSFIDLSSYLNVEKNLSTFFILAGGLGTRMKKLTKEKPKPLLLIKNKPIIEHIILRAKSQGFQNFVISLGYLGDQIKKYLKDGKQYGVSINYIIEKKKLGTAGFLSLIKIKNLDDFIVTNGDTLTNINYKEFLNFHYRNKSFATMAIQKKKSSEKLGVVHIRGSRFVDVKEKPVDTYNINTGIYVLNKNCLKFLKKNQYMDMTDFFNLLKIKKKKIIVYPIYENWLDIANKQDLKLANRNFKEYI